MDPAPDLEDLALVFEGEPVHPFGVDDAPWPYALVRFALERGERRVELGIEPASEQVDLVLSSSGEQLVHLELHDVRSVVVERRGGLDLVGLVMDERSAVGSVWLRTRPQLSLTGRIGAEE